MSALYRELVISGSFALVKGFLRGYRHGAGLEFGYFFHGRSGIRRETLAELLKEALELDSYVHVCMQGDAVEGFKRAVREAGSAVGIQVKEERAITGARFDFSFSINNRQAAADVKAVLSDLPPGVRLDGYEPVEREESVAESGSTAGYAPLHEYTFRGHGRVVGDFPGVMELYLKAKRLPGQEVLLMGEMRLEFKE